MRARDFENMGIYSSVRSSTDLDAAAQQTVGLDSPFAGALVPLSLYNKDRNVSAIMIEVNRKLYMDEETGERGQDFEDVKALLARFITGGLAHVL